MSQASPDANDVFSDGCVFNVERFSVIPFVAFT